MASYTPPPAHAAPRPASPDVTGSVPAVKPAAPSGSWNWDGGTAVTVAQGDTVDAISRKYGVPASAIMQANNLVPPAILYAGQQLVIPRYQSNASPVATTGAPATRVAAPVTPAAPARPVVAAAPAGNPGVHVVAQGETLSKIARLYGKSVVEIAKANSLQPNSALRIGERLVIPGVRVTSKKGTAVAQAQVPNEPSAEPAPQQHQSSRRRRRRARRTA